VPLISEYFILAKPNLHLPISLEIPWNGDKLLLVRDRKLELHLLDNAKLFLDLFDFSNKKNIEVLTYHFISEISGLQYFIAPYILHYHISCNFPMRES